MSDDLVPIIPVSRSLTLGDRIRNVANQLRQESAVQIKATSRILSAAAKIAENHDHLIDEVVEVVEEDLDQQSQLPQPESYTVEQLKQQFGKLSDAKAHFGVKAASWAALASKLNEQAASSHLETNPKTDPKTDSTSPQPNSTRSQDSVLQRLDAIESEIRTLRGDINQALKLLDFLVKKLP